MGWMMGPWLVFGTLLLGATMMLYDGAPDYPGPDRLWELVERHRVTALGHLADADPRAHAPRRRDRARARSLLAAQVSARPASRGIPTRGAGFSRRSGDGTLPIINYSGGTEISGGILMGNVLTPLKPCAFTGPVPGMAADVVDEHGELRARRGRRAGHPPALDRHDARLLGDPRALSRNLLARFPDIWVHGDWAAVDADGLWYILGRSDDTIKVAGKRVGPAEVESVLVGHRVSEAGGDRRARRAQGRSARLLLRAEAGHMRRANASARVARARRRSSASRLRRARCKVRPRAAQDAQRQSHAPRRAQRLSKSNRGRSVGAGKSAKRGGDTKCDLTMTTISIFCAAVSLFAF